MQFPGAWACSASCLQAGVACSPVAICPSGPPQAAGVPWGIGGEGGAPGADEIWKREVYVEG